MVITADTVLIVARIGADQLRLSLTHFQIDVKFFPVMGHLETALILFGDEMTPFQFRKAGGFREGGKGSGCTFHIGGGFGHAVDRVVTERPFFRPGTGGPFHIEGHIAEGNFRIPGKAQHRPQLIISRNGLVRKRKVFKIL